MDDQGRRCPDSAEYRLKRRADFQRVQRRGRKLYSKQFLTIVCPVDASAAVTRLGVTVTRKIDKRAVVRNLLKRRIRGVIRLNRHRFKAVFDIVVIARKDAAACSFKEVERQLLGTLRYHGYIV